MSSKPSCTLEDYVNWPSPIVEASWLQANLDSVLVADVRWSMDQGPHQQDFLDGHIPGAIFVNLDSDLSAPPGSGGRHPLPTPVEFAQALSRLGIDGSKPVVAYDDRSGAVAARLWWMLDALELPVAVLNGGLGAWVGSLDAGPGSTTPCSFEPKPWPPDRFIDADAIGEAERSGAILLDARSSERFRGEPNAIDERPGHIPGASSRPWTDNLGPDGRFAEVDVLRAELGSLGVTPERQLVASCGSGVTACHDLLACRIAGISTGQLYVGSWSEWGADASRPVATGSD